MSANPFDYLNAINSTKEDLTSTEQGEKDYPAFMVNRGLSYFRDTVFQANEMNRFQGTLAGRLQNVFLLNSISAKKRFSKWFKADKLGDLDAVKAYYGYSNQKAKDVLDLHTPEQLALLKEKLYRGGTS